PAISLSSVDLPAPLGPKSPRIVPSRKVKERLSTARSLPKRLVTPSKTTIATGLTPFGRGPRLSVCRARLDHPVVRLADHLRHLVTSVAEGVHLLDKSDERP